MRILACCTALSLCHYNDPTLAAPSLRRVADRQRCAAVPLCYLNPPPRRWRSRTTHVNLSVFYQLVDTANRPWPTNVAPRQGIPVGRRAARSFPERWPAVLPIAWIMDHAVFGSVFFAFGVVGIFGAAERHWH